jgi:hypothetical protein
VVVQLPNDDDEVEPSHWALAGNVDPNAKRFDIIIEGWCHAHASDVDRIEVIEHADSVAVAPYLDPEPDTNDSCTTLVPATVELKEPLGHRQLIGRRGAA